MPKGAEEGALATEEAGLAVRRIPTLITYLKAEPAVQAISSSTTQLAAPRQTQPAYLRVDHQVGDP